MTLRAPSEKDSALIDSLADSAQSPVAPEDSKASDDAVMSSVFIGQGPVLNNWKIMADGPQMDSHAEDDSNEDITPIVADVAQLARRERKYSERRIVTSRPVAPIWLQIGQALAVFMTVAWVTYAAIYVMAEPGIMKAITSSPLNLGGLLASVLAPVAMLCNGCQVLQRVPCTCCNVKADRWLNISWQGREMRSTPISTTDLPMTLLLGL